MLKVLYDLESEVNDDANTVDYTTTANLFHDDKEEEEEGDGKDDMLLGGDKSFESIVLSYDTSQNSITWSDLLRRMKKEIQSIWYFQVNFVNMYTFMIFYFVLISHAILNCSTSLLTGTFHHII